LLPGKSLVAERESTLLLPVTNEPRSERGFVRGGVFKYTQALSGRRRIKAALLEELEGAR